MMNRKFPEGLEKRMSQFKKIGQNLSYQNAMVASIEKQFSEYISSLHFSNLNIQIPDFYSSLQISTTEWTKSIENLSSEIFDNINTISTWSDDYSKQIQSMTESLSFVGKKMVADIASMNLSAYNFSSLGVFDRLEKLLEYHEDSAESFKTAGWTIAPSMNRDLIEKVVFLHQQKKTRHISQVILGYYHKNNFEKLKRAVDLWESNPLFFSRMHIFRAALNAHCEGLYTLSVPTLYPHIEGILNEYAKVNKLEAKLGKIKMVYEAVIGDLDEYPITSWAIVNTLCYQLQTNTFTYTDFEIEFRKPINSRKTTRHTVLHGISTNYDKPIHSLKAFVLLDALSVLQELNEEKIT